jgi:hypothetical protein
MMTYCGRCSASQLGEVCAGCMLFTTGDDDLAPDELQRRTRTMELMRPVFLFLLTTKTL